MAKDAYNTLWHKKFGGWVDDQIEKIKMKGDKDMNRTRFAAEILGKSKQHLSDLLNHRKNPSLDLMKLVQRLSNDEIQINFLTMEATASGEEPPANRVGPLSERRRKEALIKSGGEIHGQADSDILTA